MTEAVTVTAAGSKNPHIRTELPGASAEDEVEEESD